VSGWSAYTTGPIERDRVELIEVRTGLTRKRNCSTKSEPGFFAPSVSGEDHTNVISTSFLHGPFPSQ